MKKFIIKTLLYTALYTTVFFLILFVLLLSARYFSKFDVDDNKNMLMVGNSHAECAYNDTLIPKLHNYAWSGEVYFYTYHKTKKFLEQNPQIKVVFIEFSNNRIGPHTEEEIWRDRYLSYNLPKYAPFLDINEHFMLFKNNPKHLIKTLPFVFSNSIVRAVNGFHSDIEGGYNYLVREKIDSLLMALDKDKDVPNPYLTNELSTVNLDYLSKLIDYCKKNDIKPYLIRTPVHEKWNMNKNEPLFQEVLSTRFSDVEFLDFSKCSFQNSEFGDLNHLNYRGARKFSIWFNQLINDGLLERTDKQRLINERMKKHPNFGKQYN